MISINAQDDNNGTAIIYLSRTKNTEAVAKLIQAKVGCDLIKLELQKPYPENYTAIVAQVAKENETGYLPPLKTAAFYWFSYMGYAVTAAHKEFFKES